MSNLKINQDRLWDTLMEMAKIGATAKGGNKRLALTDLDAEARALFKSWCEEAGLEVGVDQMGSMFARRPGRNRDLAPVIAGSHLDTQPTGGRFDGVLGVLAGLEVARTLNDAGIETERPIEIVNWTNEEGTRFSPPMISSGVFAGAFTIDEAHAIQDEDGLTLGAELERIGYKGDEAVGGRDIHACFELHIEQGPILEAEEKTIGVVTLAMGQRWFEVSVTGEEAHAGPTPMWRRKDALVGAARMIDLVNRIGFESGNDAHATVGVIKIEPASRNVIPGSAWFTVDFRHPDDATLADMEDKLRKGCAKLAETSQVDVKVKSFWSTKPQPFAEDLVDRVRESAEAHGYSHRDIASGAGHDAVYVARVAPTAMIFVPCENGISHNEAENATPEDCAAGTNVLLRCVLETAGAVST
ncbi:MAG: Zn-dependent hydrolase [Pseudomonadota bacterium]